MQNALPPESAELVYPLEQEIVVMTLTTLVRLFEIDSDAALLYTFYCKTAKLQAQQIGYTNRIKATSDYCRKGLRWGSDRFHKAKSLLVENGFIANIVKEDANHLKVGYYVQINYLHKATGASSLQVEAKPSEADFPQNRRVGNEGTNAVYEKISADNENNIYAKSSEVSYSNSTIHNRLSPPNKAIEHISYPLEQKRKKHESRPEASKLAPLTYEQLWTIAKRKGVSLYSVRTTHQQVLDSIENGNKYKTKSVSLTTQKWIDLSLSRGNISHLTEEESILLELDNPEAMEQTQAAIRWMKERKML